MEISAWQSRIGAVQNNKAFEAFVIVVIMIAAISVGAKTFDIPPSAQNLIDYLNLLITWIFVFELTIRLLASRRKRDFFKDAWNIFDIIVVSISLIPIENSDMALVARLVRIFRVLRMVGLVPQVRLLLNSLLKAIPKLLYVMGLMFIIFYIYGTLGSMLFEAVNPVLWGNVSAAMLTLFQVMTFDDWASTMYATMEVYPWSWVYYLSFIFFVAFAFLNMVIGIIVNVLNEEYEKLNTADPDKISNQNLYQEIQKIKFLLQSQNKNPDMDS